MADWLNSPWYAILGYSLTVVLAGIIGHLQVADRKGSSWPIFWFGTALLALAMGIGRALHASGRFAELGRRQVRSAGWYEERRGLQIVVLGASAAMVVAIVLTGAMVWRHRRRAGHLAVGLLMSALVGYSVVRVVSLHQIDSFTQSNDVIGVNFGTLFELVLLAAAVTVMFKRLRSELAGDDRDNPTPPVRADQPSGIES